MYGSTLVFIQFFSLLLLFISGPITPNNIVSFSLLFFGTSLGIVALWTMKRSKIRITPGVAKDAHLIITGPYSMIRHPMYTAVLLVGLSMILNDFSIWRIVIYLTLLVNQLLKLHYEEQLLKNRFIEYQDYQMKTKKLIPYIY